MEQRTYNPSTWEANAGDDHEFKDSLDYTAKSYLERTKRKKKLEKRKRGRGGEESRGGGRRRKQNPGNLRQTKVGEGPNFCSSPKRLSSSD